MSVCRSAQYQCTVTMQITLQLSLFTIGLITAQGRSSSKKLSRSENRIKTIRQYTGGDSMMWCDVFAGPAVLDSPADGCLDIGVKNTENIRTVCLLQGQDYHNFSQKMFREILSGLWRLSMLLFTVQVKDVAEIRPGPQIRQSTAWTEWLGLSPEDTFSRFDLVCYVGRW